MSLRVLKDHVNYDVWERQGFLEATEGKRDLLQHQTGHPSAWREVQHPEIAYDRWGATQMVQHLEEAGFTVVPRSGLP